jgi:molybdenum cofactor synthesis domain-containing protein
MIHYRQALDIILSVCTPLASECIALTAACGRILATPIVAAHDVPPFTQSLVDGYALRSTDTHGATRENPIRLRISQTLTAGDVLQQPLLPQQAIRIMTGAPLPRGVQTVLKLEESEVDHDVLVVRRALAPGIAIQRRGAELRRRTVVLRAGERLTPQRIGTALSLGSGTVEVTRRPRVAFVAPGNELLPPGAPWQPGKKWCSNLYALELRAQELGNTSVNLGIVPDTLAALVARLRDGLMADVIVILGASGRGERDFAVRALTELGADMLFRGVATSPGRTVTVARHQHTLVFCLPGSPWAAFVGFEVFVWPALRALLGQRPTLPPVYEAMLTVPVQGQRGTTHFVPARLQPRSTGWHATPLAGLLALARAESAPLGLIIVPPSRRRLRQGARVRVQGLTP